MVESSAGIGLRGRSGIVSLVEGCLKEPTAADRPVTMLLGPRGSGASEAHIALMERFGPEHPFAYVNFGGTQSLLPRYALALLARQLERKLPRYGHSRFPLLSLALLASDQELNIRSLAEGRTAVRRQLDRFQHANEARHGDYLAAFFEVGMGAIGIPEGASVIALSVFQDALRRGRNRLPGRGFTSKLTTGAHWFGAHPLTRNGDPWEALVELNLWRHEGDEEDHELLDRVLFSAFLEDLRRNTSRAFMPRSYLLLLDNSHSPYGRRFLDLLVRARHDDAVVREAACDPLTVVASSNRWLPRWGPATGDAWPWQLRGPDRASLADWHNNRPTRDSEDTWWYPLRLRDLSLDEVRIRIELRMGGNPDLAPYTRLSPFVHRLTGGLPRAVQQILDVLRQSGAPAESGPDQDRWLRKLPEQPLVTGEVTRTLTDTALGHLLRGLDESEHDILAECAAARDLSVGTRVLSHGDALFGEMRARWLLAGPGALVPMLHPWLRRLLLRRLAERPGDWDTVHELLAEHFRAEGRPIQEMYHKLAVRQVDEVVDHLVGRFRAVPAVQWISEFESITAAPNRLSPDGGPLGLLASLGRGSDSHQVMDVGTVVQGLVTARWVWSDPLADPGMRLGNMIADGFTQLSQLRRDDIVPLFNEAERYRNWRHPQTMTEEG
ncbi:hypothetical protein QR77_33485 [Streptomyces sp. 150FB]|uniref:hypothetical protein n=1 Tax=Streptomyces sp. 150FB TaxID=1576605 RepID=UPI0005890FA8|nr:hypothetical protein [Streptomyces sp. 150FB]KIF77440.1 hypothetical protein QR77_33485 [Streptomyces sp. 150FB]